MYETTHQKEMSDAWKVSFIGIAAPRCGTTWISRCLSEHPEICFSNPKETFFFSKYYEKGTSFYKSFFSNPQKICGEFSPFYYTDKEVAKRIKRHNENVKLIIILRDPVLRMYSAYEYRKQKGRETFRSFSDATKKDKGYILNSKYYDLLQPFFETFEKHQIKIFILEDFKAHKRERLRELYSYLGVDQNFIPESLGQEINTAKNAHTYFPLFYRITDVRKTLKKSASGRGLIATLKAIGIGNLIAHLMVLNKGKKVSKKETVMSQSEYATLMTHFRESNEKLYEYLGYRIKDWEQKK